MDNITPDGEIIASRDPSLDEGEGILESGPPRIEPGVYNGEYTWHQTRLYMGKQPKLHVYFRITDPGDAYGVELARYYNVPKLDAKGPRKYGGFLVGKRSTYYRDFCTVLGEPKRPTRISPSAFAGKTLMLLVRDVEADGNGIGLVDSARYSIVDQVIGVVK